MESRLSSFGIEHSLLELGLLMATIAWIGHVRHSYTNMLESLLYTLHMTTSSNGTSTAQRRQIELMKISIPAYNTQLAKSNPLSSLQAT
jgi:hypothetical protein